MSSGSLVAMQTASPAIPHLEQPQQVVHRRVRPQEGHLPNAHAVQPHLQNH